MSVVTRLFPEPEAPPPDAELFPAYVEYAAQQAVADLKREVGKTKASLLLSKFLEEDDANR